MRVHFTNLGCKLNQAELEAIARRFAAAGHVVVGSLTEADLHVVNSCTVTAAAARDSRKVARRGRRRNPTIKTVLTGCYAAAEPEEAAALAGVDLVVANEDKDRLVEIVSRRLHLEPAESEVPCAHLAFGNSRALVKIEDGCNMTCSFCIIPSTRGTQRSRPASDVCREVDLLAARGTHEVILTGVQISAYRSGDDGRFRLYDLVVRVLEQTDIARLRLTSLAPWRFDRRLIDLFTHPRICRHVHLSLQSGSAETLVRMRRPYTPESFRRLVEALRARVPGIAVTTDVIVGFPGESEREFEESLRFVESIGFARVHAFPYSQRPGTEADSLPEQISPAVKKERMGRLLPVAKRGEEAFLRSQIGSTAEVLWETRRNGRWQGTTDNYLRAYHDDFAQLAGQASRARLTTVVDNGVAVQLLDSRGPNTPAGDLAGVPA